MSERPIMQPELAPNVRIARDMTVNGLTNSQMVWDHLGAQDGIAELDSNQFGDITTKYDSASEWGMRAAIVASGEPTDMISEELGGPHPINYTREGGKKARFVTTGDGCDGTAEAVAHWWEGNYGPMQATALGHDPSYGDILSAGVGRPPRHEFFYSVKGGPVIRRNTQTGEETELPRLSQEARLEPGSLVYGEMNPTITPDNPLYDFYILNNKHTELMRKAGYNPHRSGSTAGDVMDVIEGKQLAILSATRKCNLEQTATYRLMKSAGGVMYGLTRKSDKAPWQLIALDNKKFYEFGQRKHITLIAAANDGIAYQILDALNAEVPKYRMRLHHAVGRVATAKGRVARALGRN